jgi:methionyl-tRNA synthetase
MNEERAVLDFFSLTENLPLGLAVAEQMDALREQMNTQFWQALKQRLHALINEHTLPWQVAATEDRNAAGSLVGIYCSLPHEQALYLRPMMEQQFMDDN